MFNNFGFSSMDFQQLENSSSFELDNYFNYQEDLNSIIYPYNPNAIIDNIIFLEKKRSRHKERLFERPIKDELLLKVIQNVFLLDENFEENEIKIFDTNTSSTNISLNLFQRRESKNQNEKGVENISVSIISNFKQINNLKENIEGKNTDEKTKPMENHIKISLTGTEEIKIDDQKNKESNKSKFKCIRLKKPGKKINDKSEKIRNKKEHTKVSQDNIITKVQTHYISFIISLANDIILNSIGKNKDLIFKDIDYNIKKKAKSEYIEILKDLCVKDILKKPVSSKFRSTDINSNMETYDKIIKINNNLTEVIIEYFNLNYLVLFEKYINKCKPLNKINIKGKNIYFSEKTKSFYYLLKKNETIKQEIIECTTRIYFNDKNQNEYNKLF